MRAARSVPAIIATSLRKRHRCAIASNSFSVLERNPNTRKINRRTPGVTGRFQMAMPASTASRYATDPPNPKTPFQPNMVANSAEILNAAMIQHESHQELRVAKGSAFILPVEKRKQPPAVTTGTAAAKNHHRGPILSRMPPRFPASSKAVNAWSAPTELNVNTSRLESASGDTPRIRRFAAIAQVGTGIAASIERNVTNDQTSSSG